ncbi:MAG TPA: RecQ family zinc-binding domain-containing protein, partial [Flavisolibacter sp.]|nr:RecQ family zinc-binding domain-containing protein [Flavisolibacter sp.]
SKENLYEFYRSHPEYEELLVTLLRTYEGIYDFPVFISELTIAKLLREDEVKIKERLQKIAAYGVVHYTPQNDEPQIVFRKNRVATRDLQINLKQYYRRKEEFIHRVETMLAYLKTASCRSAYISHYFGDEEAKDCGICDNCLARKQHQFSSEEFALIASAIQQQLAQQPVTAEQLMAALPAVKKEQTWKVLQFLQAERKIIVSREGLLQNK